MGDCELFPVRLECGDVAAGRWCRLSQDLDGTRVVTIDPGTLAVSIIPVVDALLAGHLRPGDDE
jgi:hypothetical protein